VPAARILWIGQVSEGLASMHDDLRRLEVVLDIAGDRAASLTYADAHAYDLILLDDHSGHSSHEHLSLLTELVTRHPHVPVAVGTTAASYLGSIAAIKLGAFGYAETPRTVDALLALLHNAQEWQAARRAGAGRVG
jgi:DNA-binding NtrC family response regulator